MKYANMRPGIFLSRPNRFVAHVAFGQETAVVHVKNTGRCRELLIPGVGVWCQASDNPARKTGYDLICVEKGPLLINMDAQAPNAVAKQWLEGGGLGKIEDLRPECTHGDSRFDFAFTKDGRRNMDAQAPNAVAKQWLEGGGLGKIEDLRPECTHGDSRFDFAFTKDGRRCFLEVKGVTLEDGGVCAFPDAPTQRGTKHLRGLTQAAQEGYGAYVLFVIQMERASYLHPNDRTDPAFAQALAQAAAAGVQVLAYTCRVTPDTLELDSPVPVALERDSEGNWVLNG